MTHWMRVKLPAALLILGLACFVVFLEVEASDDSDEQTGSSAVWTPAANDLARIRQLCKAARGSDFTSCFITQMSAFGASPEAIAFTRTYAEQNRGTIAFLQGFRPADLVDLGYAYFPAAADFSQRWLLLNGSPAIIDVDDLSRLPQADMEKDPAFGAVRKRYPKVTLFDGNRLFESVPEMQTGSDGTQEFTIHYPLKDQCRACATLGTARFSFEFDPAGRLAAVKFLNVSTTGK
jgi:hypothetical protein